MSSYFRFKDCPCKDLISGIVYQISFGGFNATYIGQSEHMGVSALTGKKLSASAPLTAVREHLLECDHRVCSEDFSILFHAKNSKKSTALYVMLFIHYANPIFIY